MRLLSLLFALLPCACARAPAGGQNQDLAKSIGRVFLEGLTAENFLQVHADAAAGRIGGVVVFAPAFRSAADLRAKIAELRRAAPWPLVIAIDGEGGRVLRVPGLEAASAAELGRKGVGAVRLEAGRIARTLRDDGINLNLAPVVDLAVDSQNPLVRDGRCFSGDAGAVTVAAREFVKAHGELGVGTTLKHFPGHGSSRGDTHRGAVDITSTWRDDELKPYRELIAGGFDGAVMVGHLFNRRIDPAYPASLSRPTIEGLLREKLGFRGPVVTDDLQMGAVARDHSLRAAAELALAAGADLLIVGQRYRNDDLAATEEWLVNEVKAGRLPPERVESAAARTVSLAKLKGTSSPELSSR